MKKVIEFDIGIKKQSDGILVWYRFQGDEQDVWERYKTEDETKDELVNFLYDLLEEIGGSGTGKYDRVRIKIKQVHGRGYECKEKDCSLCKENDRL